MELRKSVADAPSCHGRGMDGKPEALEYSNISRLLNRVEPKLFRSAFDRYLVDSLQQCSCHSAFAEFFNDGQLRHVKCRGVPILSLIHI